MAFPQSYASRFNNSDIPARLAEVYSRTIEGFRRQRPEP